MHRLDPQTVASLSFVKNPVTFRNVVRALIENSIDAGSTQIEIGISSSGYEKLFVHDNGCGIKRNDAPNLCSFYTTNKIRSFEDIQNSELFGFKGSSLATISCLCQHVDILSQHFEEKTGFSASYAFSSLVGKIKSEIDSINSHGTYVILQKLFQNIPDSQETSQRNSETAQILQTIITEYYVQYPTITFIIYINQIIFKQFTGTDNSNSLMCNIYEHASKDKNIFIPLNVDTEKGKQGTIICGNPQYQFNKKQIFCYSLNVRIYYPLILVLD